MNLTIARLEALGPIRVEGEKMFAGQQALNDFHTPLDELERATGEGRTIFLGNQRIATTVKMPDGRRVVGTRLESQAVLQTVLRDGRQRGAHPRGVSLRRATGRAPPPRRP